MGVLSLSTSSVLALLPNVLEGAVQLYNTTHTAREIRVTKLPTPNQRWTVSSTSVHGDRAIHLKTIHLSPFYLETGYCHGRVRVTVTVRNQEIVHCEPCLSKILTTNYVQTRVTYHKVNNYNWEHAMIENSGLNYSQKGHDCGKKNNVRQYLNNKDVESCNIIGGRLQYKEAIGSYSSRGSNKSRFF